MPRTILRLPAAALLVLLLTAAQQPSAPPPPAPPPAPGMPPIGPETKRSGGPLSAERAALRIERLALAVEILPERRMLSAIATLTLRTDSPVSRIVLDLDPNLVVGAVAIDGAEQPAGSWSNPDGRLVIPLPAPIAAGGRTALRITYAGTPHVAVRAPWDDGIVWSSADGKPWLGTTAQGYGCDLIWPCLDFPGGEVGVADLAVTVPAGLSAPANGRLIAVDTLPDGRTTWRWRARSVNPYSIALTAGPFAELKGSYRSRFGNIVPLHFWHLPARREDAERLFAEFAPTLDFFESMIGPYPFGAEKLGVVETPYLGMEHQTINAYGNGYKPGVEGFDWLFQHELAHEWFGNQMTAADWDDFWLHEGFGQYMQPLYGQWREGDARYVEMLARYRLLIENAQPIVAGRSRTSDEVYETKLGGPGTDIYYKGAWILHTLRYVVGDAAFFDATRRLVYGRPDPRPGNFAPRFATTRLFEALVARAAGRDMGWFFDAYLRHAALPELIETREGDRLTLTWRTPAGRPFPLPVEIAVDGRVRRIAMTGGSAAVAVPAGAHVVIDPMARVLRYSAAIERYRAARTDKR